jgi:hypothetical protein
VSRKAAWHRNPLAPKGLLGPPPPKRKVELAVESGMGPWAPPAPLLRAALGLLTDRCPSGDLFGDQKMYKVLFILMAPAVAAGGGLAGLQDGDGAPVGEEFKGERAARSEKARRCSAQARGAKGSHQAEIRLKAEEIRARHEAEAAGRRAEAEQRRSQLQAQAAAFRALAAQRAEACRKAFRAGTAAKAREFPTAATAAREGGRCAGVRATKGCRAGKKAAAEFRNKCRRKAEPEPPLDETVQ